MLTSAESRHSPFAACHKSDVVLVMGDDALTYVAAEVWFHADVNGQPLSLVSFWRPMRIDRDAGTAE